MFKKLALIVIVALAFEALCLGVVEVHRRSEINRYQRSDVFAREHILQLYGNNILCTGVEVLGPSHKVYTLTAAHCKGLIIDNGASFQKENKDRGRLDVISVDQELDLLLLQGTTETGFKIGDGLTLYQHVHTVSHGIGMPAYRTDGELLAVDAYLPTPDGTVSPRRLITTAEVEPGSSGGPLLDDSGNLIGIIHARRNDFGIFSFEVSLSDIQKFMKGR